MVSTVPFLFDGNSYESPPNVKETLGVALAGAEGLVALAGAEVALAWEAAALCSHTSSEGIFIGSCEGVFVVAEAGMNFPVVFAEAGMTFPSLPCVLGIRLTIPRGFPCGWRPGLGCHLGYSSIELNL